MNGRRRLSLLLWVGGALLAGRAALRRRRAFDLRGKTAPGLMNRLLPGPGGLGTGSALGWQSQSWLSPSWLTSLSDQAAQQNNEMNGGRKGNGGHGSKN